MDRLDEQFLLDRFHRRLDLFAFADRGDHLVQQRFDLLSGHEGPVHDRHALFDLGGKLHNGAYQHERLFAGKQIVRKVADQALDAMVLEKRVEVLEQEDGELGRLLHQGQHFEFGVELGGTLRAGDSVHGGPDAARDGPRVERSSTSFANGAYPFLDALLFVRDDVDDGVSRPNQDFEFGLWLHQSRIIREPQRSVTGLPQIRWLFSTFRHPEPALLFFRSA